MGGVGGGCGCVCFDNPQTHTRVQIAPHFRPVCLRFLTGLLEDASYSTKLKTVPMLPLQTRISSSGPNLRKRHQSGNSGAISYVILSSNLLTCLCVHCRFSRPENSHPLSMTLCLQSILLLSSQNDSFEMSNSTLYVQLFLE